jgi:hypothetical protein
MDYRPISAVIVILAIGGAFIQFNEIEQLIGHNVEEENPNYELRLNNFTIGNDVAEPITEENSSVPVYFTIENPIHGLKGITPKNISYKLKLNGSEDRYCETSRIKVKDEIEPGNEVEIQDDISKHLDTENCILNQTESDLTAFVDLRYDYRSMSSLVMGVGEKSDNKSLIYSETANTIVEPQMSVENPLSSKDFEINVTFETNPNVKYQVSELKIMSPSNLSRNNCDLEKLEGIWMSSETSQILSCKMSVEEETGQEDIAISLDSEFTVVETVKQLD